MDNSKIIISRLNALAKSRFRAGFRLSPADRALVREKGLPVMRRHAEELLSMRLFPAYPANDGRQTPMRGYPVFVAQHATATCCRSCLEKWHRVAKGRELTPSGQTYVLDLIQVWIADQLDQVGLPHEKAR